MQKTTDKTSYQDSLRQAGLSLTKTRAALFEVLSKSDNPLTIQEIVKQIDSAHFVSVYRSIDALTKAGIVKQVSIGFKNKFELSDQFKPHHHHVTCENCGRSLSVDDERIEQLMGELTKQAGFAPTHHHFEAYGICRQCRQ